MLCPAIMLLQLRFTQVAVSFISAFPLSGLYRIFPYGVDRVCTLHFVEYIIFVQQMHNIFIKNYLYLIVLLHVSMFRHHPQGIYYYVR